MDEACLDSLADGVRRFRGSKRRCELVGEKEGILVMDDYGHHPTAVDLTLKGLKEFYPGRRLVVDFMSHTYSRTAALLKDSLPLSLRPIVLFCTKYTPRPGRVMTEP